MANLILLTTKYKANFIQVEVQSNLFPVHIVENWNS